jgi:pimeloyl-ACP methyl ester carboxylesterase
MYAARLAVAGLVAASVAVLPTGTSSAAGAPPARSTHVVSRQVVFELENTNATSVLCTPDNASYTVRGRLIGPRKDVLGADAARMNVLVHDMTAGSWFWHLRSHPAYDYATQLARAGETSLVFDRLGYDSSPLADGNATCLGAQADMLHQVVQHLKSGSYHFRNSHRGTPAAQHVVVHGHSVGAAIAEAEAATFDDVDGLVLMSWTDGGASQRAVDEASQQSTTCLKGEDYAHYGQSGADFRRLLFATAPGKVQRAASSRRNADPCGDALSLTQLVTSLNLTTRDVEAPVLLLFGGRDALTRKDAAQAQADAFSSSVSVTEHTVKGAGSALPLERSAPRTRARVERWLDTLD